MRRSVNADPETQPALYRLLTSRSEPSESLEPVAEGYRPLTHCPAPCGAELAFDPIAEGETVGGLHLVGWLVCPACGRGWLADKGRCRVAGGRWKLAAGGRSLDADGCRLRAEGAPAHLDVAALMRRIAHLPDLEAALRRIARGCDDPAAVARLALGAVINALDSDDGCG